MQKAYALTGALWLGLQAFATDASADAHYICQHATTEGGGATTGYVYCYWEWDYEEITGPEEDWNMPGGGGGNAAQEIYTMTLQDLEFQTRGDNCQTPLNLRREYAAENIAYTEDLAGVEYPPGTIFITYFSNLQGGRTGHERWVLNSRPNGQPTDLTRTVCTSN